MKLKETYPTPEFIDTVDTILGILSEKMPGAPMVVIAGNPGNNDGERMETTLRSNLRGAELIQVLELALEVAKGGGWDA